MPQIARAQRRLPVGAEILSGTGESEVHFRVWAPKCQAVEAVITTSRAQGGLDRVVALAPESDGYFSGSTPAFGGAVM